MQRLINIAKILDPEPERNSLRALLKQADLKSHRQILATIAGQSKVIAYSPTTALLLARSLDMAGDGKERDRYSTSRRDPISGRPVDQLRACDASL